MIVRHDFDGSDQMPPKAFLAQIWDTLTNLYVFLWDKKDKENRVAMTWKELSQYYNKNLFRTKVRKLCAEGLLNYDQTEDGFSLELVGWDDIDG